MTDKSILFMPDMTFVSLEVPTSEDLKNQMDTITPVVVAIGAAADAMNSYILEVTEIFNQITDMEEKCQDQ